MKRIFTMLSILILLHSQDIHNGKKPLYENAFLLKEIVTIKDEEDNFYGSIDTHISPDNKIIVLDRGNFRALVYNITGNKVLEFGREGHGPGEFSGIFDPVATNDYLLFYSNQRLMIYDYSGKLISEISGDFYNKIVTQPKEKYIQLYYIPDKGSPQLTAKYTYTGELINSEERGYDDKVPYNVKTREDWYNNYIPFYREKLAFFPFRENFIRFDRTEYRLDVVDVFGKKKKSVFRKFDRIKYTQNDFFSMTEEERSKSKEELEKLAKFYANANKRLMEASEGYKSDIFKIAGTYDDKFLFVWANSEKKDTIILDIFDQDYNFFTQLILEAEGLDFCKIVNNKLICEYITYEAGHFFKVFDLVLAEK